MFFNEHITGSMNIYTKHNINELRDKILKKYNRNSEEMIRLKLVDGKNCRSFNLNKIVQKRIHLDNFKTVLKKDKDLFVNVDSYNKYCVTIKNNESIKNDVRNVMIISHKNINEVRDILIKIMERREKRNDKIVFDVVNKNKKSHHIIIRKVVCEMSIKIPSKSFSFNLNNYSSEEIGNIIRRNKNVITIKRRKKNEK